VRVFLTGGHGVLGRILTRQLLRAGHAVTAPRHFELDLFNLDDITNAMSGAEAVYHLATRIPPPEARGLPGAWEENDRLRAEGSRVLVDAALANGVQTLIFPSVAFVYPDAPSDEDTPPRATEQTRTALEAERQVQRFTDAGGCGVVLRLGLLWGSTTGLDGPDPRFGATLHISDAGSALLAALDVPAGIYNVTSDGERVSNAKFKAACGWAPAF
jgi:nucleoside-diphosphate-sugar epimerase